MALSSVLGQERALGRLRKMLSSRRIPPALLFTGPQGVGKKKAAFEFAKALNCEAPDFVQQDSCDRCPSCGQADKGLDADLRIVDMAYQAALREEEGAKQRTLRVDTVRHAIHETEMRSLMGRRKTMIVEDAHLLAEEGANALLKSLEEPPEGTLWILLTHQPHRLLGTIRSRSQVVRFSPLTVDAVRTILLRLPQEEVEASLEQSSIDTTDASWAAHRAEGSMHRALALLKKECPDPEQWLEDPLAPFRLSESLPKELHLSRPLVEEHLLRMTRHLRSRRDARARKVARELSGFRSALASNADPRLTLELAALTLQGMDPS
ncbi:MAG: hypothetical protein WCU88_01520 [Elusimicrobiota bacterium]|jgi:DNA polymerase III delta' subunit